MTFKHQLGASAIDTISSFHGAITARAEYVGTTNRRYEVTPLHADANGKPIDPQWFDEGRLVTGTQPDEQG